MIQNFAAQTVRNTDLKNRHKFSSYLTENTKLSPLQSKIR